MRVFGDSAAEGLAERIRAGERAGWTATGGSPIGETGESAGSVNRAPAPGWAGQLRREQMMRSVVRASEKSFRIAWIEHAYEDGTELWSAILTLIIQTPHTEERLRKSRSASISTRSPGHGNWEAVVKQIITLATAALLPLAA